VFYCTFVRIEKRITQRKLAKTTGIRQPVISHIEKGRIVPTDSERKVLAKALGITPDHLLRHVSAAPLGDGAEFHDVQREKAGA
jgi:transcriptional regulator with XRE-family HTH domain